jgi:hypothetical protein
MCCCHCQCLSSFALRLIVVAEHTVPRGYNPDKRACVPSYSCIAYCGLNNTADNDPPFRHRPGAFRPIFPINARKTQESIRTEGLILRALRENFCEYWTTVSWSYSVLYFPTIRRQAGAINRMCQMPKESQLDIWSACKVSCSMEFPPNRSTSSRTRFSSIFRTSRVYSKDFE